MSNSNIIPDQVPDINVGNTLGIPHYATVDLPDLQTDNVCINWNTEKKDFDIYSSGSWKSLTEHLDLINTFVTSEEFYNVDIMTYTSTLQQSIVLMQTELLEIQNLLGMGIADNETKQFILDVK